MNLRLLLLVFIAIFTFGMASAFAQWTVYKCDDLPENFGNPPGSVFIEKDITPGVTENGVSDLYEVIPDPDHTGNSLLLGEELWGDRRESWGHEWNVDPLTGVTVVIRCKPTPGILNEPSNPADPNTYAYVSLRNGSFREKIYIEEPGQIWFDDQEIGVNWAGYEGWHLYRFTLDIDFVNAYIDEDPTPVFFGITTKPTTDNELRWGDGSTDRKFGSYIDWIIWDTTGAYAPGQGTPLPSDIITGVNDDVINIPTNYYLLQNYPNPFNPSTVIKYQILELSFVTLKVYDVLGNEVVTLANEEKHIGTHAVEFNASALPSGIYFYRLQAGPFVETKKMILLK